MDEKANAYGNYRKPGNGKRGPKRNQPRRKPTQNRGPKSRIYQGVTMGKGGYGSKGGISKEEVKDLISKSIATADMTEAGAHMVEAILNPAHQNDTYFSPTRLLDGHGNKTVLTKLSGQTSVAAGTFTSAFLQLVGVAGAVGTQDQSFQITYGAAADDGTATMNAVTEYFDIESDNFKANVGASTFMRRVSAFIRVLPNSSDEAQGFLCGWDTHRLARTAAATWVNNNNLTNGKPSGAPIFTLKEGITVRSLADKGFDTFKVPNTAIYTGVPNAGLNAWGHMPIVQVTGLSADAVLTIQWGYVMELETLSAFPYVAERPTFEHEYQELLNIINSQSPVASGNSFASFMKDIWNKGKSVYRWGKRNKNEILGISEGIGKLMA